MNLVGTIITVIGGVVVALIGSYFMYRRSVRVDAPAAERADAQELIGKYRQYGQDLEQRLGETEERAKDSERKVAEQARQLADQNDRLTKLTHRVEHLEEAERRAKAAEDYVAILLAHLQAGGGLPPPDRPAAD